MAGPPSVAKKLRSRGGHARPPGYKLMPGEFDPTNDPDAVKKAKQFMQRQKDGLNGKSGNV